MCGKYVQTYMMKIYFVLLFYLCFNLIFIPTIVYIYFDVKLLVYNPANYSFYAIFVW